MLSKGTSLDSAVSSSSGHVESSSGSALPFARIPRMAAIGRHRQLATLPRARAQNQVAEQSGPPKPLYTNANMPLDPDGRTYHLNTRVSSRTG